MNVLRLVICCFAPLLAGAPSIRAEEILIPRGAKSTWQYLDAGQPADKTWATPAFDASRWKTGKAPLGYGTSDMATTISFGANAQAKPVTAFFRHPVVVPDPAKIGTIVVEIRRDDGAVVYWNGKEIARTNMPAGTITPDTPAVQALSDDTEGTFHRYEIPANNAAVCKGENILAVEVHQADRRSSDLIFDLEATVYAPGELPKVDYYAEAVAALRTGDRNRALPLLLKIDPAREGYARFMLQAASLFASRSGPPDERCFTLLDKARAAAPDDMEIVYGWIRARVDARRDLPIKPVRREYPAAIPDEFRFIADTPPGKDSSRLLPRDKLLADVDDLELILENCYSYLERRSANYRGALDALRASLTGATGLATFAHRVSRALTVFGDPHSRLTSGSPPAPRIPVLFVMEGERLAALSPDRSDSLEPGHPFVETINGRPAAEWLAAAERLVPQASPQYRRRMALEALTDTRAIARELKVQETPVTLTLSSPDGSGTKARELKAGGSRSSGRGAWPESKSELRNDGIGYLRLSEMENGAPFIASLNGWMTRFADTRGLVIDVRGNSGGTQDAIKTILPWLMKPGSPMKIINVAAYRLPVPLPEPNPSGFLGLFGRGLHPVTSKVWTPEQAAQIRTFLAAWEPKWKLPPGKFSDWHFMGITRESNSAAGYYEKPVIVLQDEGCFSATDNFLGALKGHPGVTLMGTVSGGGSGRMAGYTLPNSRLTLTLCQMASFATSGLTYDGNGVAPDIVLAPKLEDYLSGKSDSLLDAAVARLLDK